jgi:3'-5' exoribonuclease 1
MHLCLQRLHEDFDFQKIIVLLYIYLLSKPMNYIVFDLEATCWAEKGKHQHEIIEIGALKINENQKIIEEFNVFIKPVLHPQLSAFCTNLTSIKQQSIDNSQNFPMVIEQFKNWIGLEDEYLLCSWGFYDRKQLIADCSLHELDYKWCNNHISLKHQHARITNHERPIGLENAMNFEKMQFEGTAHRGIDDARNIARIFLKYFEKWERIGNDH